HQAPSTWHPAPLLLVYRPRLPSAIVAAVRTHAVRQFRLVTVRALAEADRLQRVMRPALRRPRLRVSSFWIGHRYLSEFLTRNCLSAASRGSSQSRLQSHVPRFRFVPHTAHSPSQSSRHKGFIGSAK